MSDHSRFEPSPVISRARRVFEASQTVRATPSRVFPLLCPVREYDWIPDWDCRLVYTESGVAEPHCVFQTEREADIGPHGSPDTWVISRHQPNVAISFVRVNPLRAMCYEIELSAPAPNLTRLSWRQVITALSRLGDGHVEALDPKAFAAQVSTMEQLMQAYLDRREG